MCIAIENYEQAIKLDSMVASSVLEELEELKLISALIIETRQTRELQLNQCSNKQEAEVARCFLNLSSRVFVA